MLETELKSLLDKNTFEKIKNHYNWDKIFSQENHYYTDTTGVLAKNRATFRIRVIDNIPKLQIKLHKNRNSALQICEEKEFDIDTIPEQISEQDAKKYTELDTGKLIKLGSNVTLRHSYMYNKNVEICLDYNTYLDIEDYEIEVEYVGECPTKLLDELKGLGVAFTEKSSGKYSRFIKRFNEVFFR